MEKINQIKVGSLRSLKLIKCSQTAELKRAHKVPISGTIEIIPLQNLQILKEYYEQLYTCKLNNLDKLDKFP